VIGEVSIVLKVQNSGKNSHLILGPYNGRDVVRTYLNPSRAIMTGVLEASLDTVMQTISSDEQLVQIVKKN
jgi:hypothetical protein